MITSLTWIPRGAARSRPARYEITPEEFKRIKQLADEESGNQDGDEEFKPSGATFEVEDEEVDLSSLPADLKMDDYDKEEIGEDEYERIEMIQSGDSAFALEADSDDEDAEDDEIRPTDSLVVVAITEDEYSHLEIQLLSEDLNLYTHHDITLPEFPICIAWMDCPPYQTNGSQISIGNYCAVGTFDPAIEIWNLDVMDPLEPTAVLGGKLPEKKTRLKKKKGDKNISFKPGSHTDAVMALGWNATYRQALASGSADKTVKIWDVTTQTCSHTFNHHKDKVQSVLWHLSEAWLLTSASFDKSVAFLDCRTGGMSGNVKLSSDPECATWDPHFPYHLYCALENGSVVCIDIRSIQGGGTSSHLFQFQAHDVTTSSISFSASVPGLLATGSVDKTVKIWDTQCGGVVVGGVAPKQVAYKTMGVGRLFALQFSSDDPFMLASGGDGGMLAIWDCDEQELIASHFQNRAIAKAPSKYEFTRFESGEENSVDAKNMLGQDGNVVESSSMDMDGVDEGGEEDEGADEVVDNSAKKKKKKKKKAKAV